MENTKKLSKKNDVNTRIASIEKDSKDLLNRISSLEKTLSTKNSVNDKSEDRNERKALKEHIFNLEQERIALLEEVTSLESQQLIAAEIEQERDSLREIAKMLEIDKENLLQSIDLFTEERKNFIEKIAKMENTGNTLYFQKERRDMEDEAAKLKFDNNRLNSQVQNNDISINEMKNKINEIKTYEQELSVSNRKIQSLEKNISELEMKQEKALDQITSMKEEVSSSQIINKANLELLEKISFLENGNRALVEKNLVLEQDKKELVEMNINNERIKASNVGSETLKEKLRELEEERGHLFKIIGKMEDEKNVLPCLDDKNSSLEEELQRAENNIKDLRKALADMQKQNISDAKKISLLEERRGTRLSLEQDNSSLQKKVSILQEEIKQLKDKGGEYYSGETGVDECKQLKIKVDELQSINKQFTEEIMLLKGQRRELLETMEKLKCCNNQPDYMLDREKLAELKEFTLEAIQARRWKSAEFVNGAYDAIGLFYRALIADRPIQKKIK